MPILTIREGFRGRINYWTNRSIPLVIKCNGHVIGTATGFCCRRGSKNFLVTNWHVLSGRNPINGKSFDIRNGAIPDEIHYPRLTDKDDPNKIVWSSVSLRNLDGNASWLAHRIHGSSVDVAAIEVPEQEPISGILPKSSFLAPVDMIGDISKPGKNSMEQDWAGKYFEVGSDVFVIGFPLDLEIAGHFPIWKRASIASEMDIPIRGLPSFLLDTATRPGMSGSPVVHCTMSVGGFSNTEIIRKASFIGIYSGRYIGEKEVEAQLGIVWKPELINQVLADGVTDFLP